MSDENEVGRAVKILSHEIDRYILSCGVDEVTGVQGRLIGFLYNRAKTGDVFQRDIEERFNIRRSTVAGMLKTMEQNGLITRCGVAGDARLKKIMLTKKALCCHSQIQKGIEMVEKRMKEGFSKAEVKLFIETANKMRENLRIKGEKL